MSKIQSKLSIAMVLFLLLSLFALSSTAQQPDVEAPPTEAGDVEACADKKGMFHGWTNIADFECPGGWQSAGSYYDAVDESCTLLYSCGGRTNWLNVKLNKDGSVTVTYFVDHDNNQFSGEPDVEGPGPGDESGQATPECEMFHRALSITATDGTTYSCAEPGFELRSTRKNYSSVFGELLSCESQYKCAASGVYIVVKHDYTTGETTARRIS